jgi:hypothetical protein
VTTNSVAPNPLLGTGSACSTTQAPSSNQRPVDAPPSTASTNPPGSSDGRETAATQQAICTQGLEGTVPRMRAAGSSGNGVIHRHAQTLRGIYKLREAQTPASLWRGGASSIGRFVVVRHLSPLLGSAAPQNELGRSGRLTAACSVTSRAGAAGAAPGSSCALPPDTAALPGGWYETGAGIRTIRAYFDARSCLGSCNDEFEQFVKDARATNGAFQLSVFLVGDIPFDPEAGALFFALISRPSC